MDTNEFDYYLVNPVFDGHIPMVRDDDDYPPRQDPYRLCLASPIPKTPRMVDYHSLDGAKAVYSQKVYDVLAPLNIKEVYLNPAIIRCQKKKGTRKPIILAIIGGKKDKEFDNYYKMNVMNEYLTFDKDKSVYTTFEDGRWLSIDKIVLNIDALSEIPLEERLIYKSEEHSGYTLYHKSIVDIIMSVNPEGVCFTSVEVWKEGMQFDK